ncbi:protein phosphatase 1D-like [Dysidea avara]|uniref:protein phosphatase 1D-like n=1 Tax=Dysidea avara TaxID=196820 RepID=UPI0033339213
MAGVSQLTAMFWGRSSSPGGRKNMEDFTEVSTMYTSKGLGFLAVYDGHGGSDAAKFAKDNLWASIKTRDGFESEDTFEVALAIRAGFLYTHEEMWKVRDLWKKTKYGEPSIAGTTVACAIIESYRVFIANVGDSTVVLGKSNLNDREPKILAEIITRDHSPTLTYCSLLKGLWYVVPSDHHHPIIILSCNNS